MFSIVTVKSTTFVHNDVIRVYTVVQKCAIPSEPITKYVRVGSKKVSGPRVVLLRRCGFQEVSNETDLTFTQLFGVVRKFLCNIVCTIVVETTVTNLVAFDSSRPRNRTASDVLSCCSFHRRSRSESPDSRFRHLREKK